MAIPGPYSGVSSLAFVCRHLTLSFCSSTSPFLCLFTCLFECGRWLAHRLLPSELCMAAWSSPISRYVIWCQSCFFSSVGCHFCRLFDLDSMISIDYGIIIINISILPRLFFLFLRIYFSRVQILKRNPIETLFPEHGNGVYH